MTTKNYDEYRPAHLDDSPIEDDESYPPLRNPGPGTDDDFAPDDELPEWLQFAIEAEEEERINELARQHEEQQRNKAPKTEIKFSTEGDKNE
jgi:hypothetical protein